MQTEQKDKIRELTLKRIQVVGNDAKYCTQIGVSSGTLYNLRKGKWDVISDEMWNKLAAGCDYTGDNWVVVKTTRNYSDVTMLLNEAKTFSEVYAFISPAGSSKTQAIKDFTSACADVALVQCEEHWNKKEFLSRLYRAFGQNPDGLRLPELMDAIQSVAIKSTTPPLIILDEIDKVNDQILHFFISIYNRLEGECGIVMFCTDYLKHRIEKGLRLRKKGYAEFYSRIGGRFIVGAAPTVQDITAICLANGLKNPAHIEKIVETCNQDLRRVKRLVNAEKRKK